MNPVWTQLLQELSLCYPEREARAIVRVVQEVGFGITPLQVCMGTDRPLTTEEREKLQNILARLKKNEPVQYVLGQADFCGLCLYVDSGVLIPRPETEELVQWVLDTPLPRTARLLDVGTGSGCIALALASALPSMRIEGVDVSANALSVARRNASSLELDVTFYGMDILTPDTDAFLPEVQWDVVVSNPPYICQHEAKQMESHVLDYEPSTALFVPDDEPLLFYEAIARFARHRLRPGGWLFFEINAAWGQATCRLLQELGLDEVELRQDFCGRDRMIRARKPND